MKKTILTRIIGTKNESKVSLEFATEVSRPNQKTNILALMNAGDERFNQPSLRYGWMTAEKSQVKALLGFDVDNLANKEELIVEMENPTIAGTPVCVQINESIEPNAQDAALPVQNRYGLKRLSNDKGKFLFYAKGTKNLVYQYSSIVPTAECTHTFVELEQVAEEAVFAEVSKTEVLDKPF